MTVDIKTAQGTTDYNAIVVGAGFAGLYMLHRLRSSGLKVRVLEAGNGAGGTWFWNRYPGARCDIESTQYSYQFSSELEQEWNWSERYAAQPEILKYVEHVIERFNLRDDIQFNTRVESAVFDEASARWVVTPTEGKALTAQFCIMATGCLSSTNLPHFEGLESFKGATYHTGQWPQQGVDFTGLRVAVIGTGSSAVQSIPIIAEECKQLTVFQRTPNYSIPAYNAPLTDEERDRIKANYPAIREFGKRQFLAYDLQMNEKLAADATPEEIRAECEKRWRLGGLYFYGAFADLLLDEQVNQTIADFVRDKIKEKVKDPVVADLLTPKSIFGCKRICADTNYFETFNRDNVLLVDVSKEPIAEITPTGVRVGDRVYEVDAIVFATGFDAMTGALNRIDIRGRGDLALREKWAAGPRTYLGLTTAGFPNLFTISGPGSPSVLTCMITSIEQHVEFIGDTIDHLRAKQLRLIEATEDAEEAWVTHVNEVAAGTLLNSCNSWYLGANIPGKRRVFMPYVGFPPYVEKCNEVVANDYEGFRLGAA
ncbi:MAG: NAD(P)/FAD-dependent oxidoreductase [Gammaproteobacteria bacterium]|nr:NAD(P)/FAD-dependent oxidoreductase [Gammaproteobacteria bacterium]